MFGNPPGSRTPTPAPASAGAASPASQAVLIDVRSAAEYAGGSIPGAVHLPLDRLLQDITRVVPDRSTPVVLFCASGGRSGVGAAALQQMGYTHASNGGGIGMLASRLRQG